MNMFDKYSWYNCLLKLGTEGKESINLLHFFSDRFPISSLESDGLISVTSCIHAQVLKFCEIERKKSAGCENFNYCNFQFYLAEVNYLRFNGSAFISGRLAFFPHLSLSFPQKRASVRKSGESGKPGKKESLPTVIIINNNAAANQNRLLIVEMPDHNASIMKRFSPRQRG